MKEGFYISDWDMMMHQWPDCPVDGCKNKINLNLNSGKCFPHSEGSYQWKSFKILFKNTFIHSPKLLWRDWKLILKDRKENNYSFMKNMEKLKNLLMGLGLATILYVLMLMMFVLNETGSGF